MQVDNQLIDGTLLPQHALGHTYMLMAGENAIILADVERTCNRFRRFTVTSRILPADGQPAAHQPDPAP
jgi:hypothetical protein